MSVQGTKLCAQNMCLLRKLYQWAEVESRTQGSRPRPRTQKNFEAKAKYQGHRRKCSPKKRFSIFFSGDLKKKVFKNFFQAKKVFKKFSSGDLYLRKPKKRSLQIFHKVSGVFQQNFYGSKIVLSSSRGQNIFEDLKRQGTQNHCFLSFESC